MNGRFVSKTKSVTMYTHVERGRTACGDTLGRDATMSDVNDTVKQFVRYFYRHIKAKNGAYRRASSS